MRSARNGSLNSIAEVVLPEEEEETHRYRQLYCVVIPLSTAGCTLAWMRSHSSSTRRCEP